MKRLALFALVLALASACDESSPQDTEDTASTDAAADAASDSAADTRDDTAADTTADSDAAEDTLDTGPPPSDRDRDFIPNARDNCPDTPNSAQEDGDEDGLGDACDPCPAIYGPEGDASACERVTEEEPNTFDGIDLGPVPFTIEGTIGDYEAAGRREGDFDYWTFEAEAGTLLQLDLDVLESQCFCGVEVGYISGSQEFLRLFFAPNGTVATREMFIPYDGSYYLLVYDLLNLQPVPGAAGGPEHTYTVRGFTIPFADRIEEAEAFPITYSGGNDSRVRFTRADVPDDRVIRVEATSAPLVDNAVHAPALILWDPVNESVIAYNDDLDTTDTFASVLSPPSPSGELLLVEDFGVTWQVNTVSVVASLEEPIGEREPNNVSSDPTAIATGRPARGVIGTTGDSDYFVFSVPAGVRVRATATADEGSSFVPELSLATRATGFLRTLLRNRSGSGLLEYLTTEPGVLLVRVADLNSGSGADHTYTLLVELSEPAPAEAGALPVDVSDALDPPGAHLLYRVDVPANTPVQLSAEGAGADLSGDLIIRAYDPEARRFLGEADGRRLAIASPTDASVLVDIGVDNGSGGADATARLTAEAAAVNEVSASPYTASLSLEPGALDYFGVSLEPGELLSINLSDPEGLSTNLAIRDAGTFEVLAARSNSSWLLYAEPGRARDVIVTVTNRSSTSAGTGTLGIQVVTPQTLGAEGSISAMLPGPGTAAYAWLDLEEATHIQLEATSAEASFAPVISVYEGDLSRRDMAQANLPLLAFGQGAGRALVEVRDVNADGGFEITLDAGPIQAEEPSLPLDESGVLDAATGRRVFRFELLEGEVFDASLQTSSETLYAELRLIDAESGELIMTSDDAFGLGRYNVNARSAFLILEDATGATAPGFDYTLRVRQAQAIRIDEASGDNGSFDTAQSFTDVPPVRINATLSSSDVDMVAVTLEPGEQLRAFTSYAEAGSETFYSYLRLYDPDQLQLDQRTFELEDNLFGYLTHTHEGDAAATYFVEVSAILTNGSDPYSLVLFVE